MNYLNKIIDFGKKNFFWFYMAALASFFVYVVCYFAYMFTINYDVPDIIGTTLENLTYLALLGLGGWFLWKKEIKKAGIFLLIVVGGVLYNAFDNIFSWICYSEFCSLSSYRAYADVIWRIYYPLYTVSISALSVSAFIDLFFHKSWAKPIETVAGIVLVGTEALYFILDFVAVCMKQNGWVSVFGDIYSACFYAMIVCGLDYFLAADGSAKKEAATEEVYAVEDTVEETDPEKGE